MNDVPISSATNIKKSSQVSTIPSSRRCRGVSINIMELSKGVDDAEAHWEGVLRGVPGGKATEFILVVFGQGPVHDLARNAQQGEAGDAMQLLLPLGSIMDKLYSLAPPPVLSFQHNLQEQSTDSVLARLNPGDVSTTDGVAAAWLLPDVTNGCAQTAQALSVLYVQLACGEHSRVDRSAARHRAMQILRTTLGVVEEPWRTRIYIDFSGVTHLMHLVAGLEELQEVWLDLKNSPVLGAAAAHVLDFTPSTFKTYVLDPGTDKENPGIQGDSPCEYNTMSEATDSDEAALQQSVGSLSNGGSEITRGVSLHPPAEAGHMEELGLLPQLSASVPATSAASLSAISFSAGSEAGVKGSDGDVVMDESNNGRLSQTSSGCATGDANGACWRQFRSSSEEGSLRNALGTESNSCTPLSGDVFREVSLYSESALVPCLFIESPVDPFSFPLNADVELRRLLVSWSALGKARGRLHLIVVVSDGDHRFEEALLSWARRPWSENALIVPIFAVGSKKFCREHGEDRMPLSLPDRDTAEDALSAVTSLVQILSFAVRYFGIDVGCSACLSITSPFLQAASYLDISTCGNCSHVSEWIEDSNGGRPLSDISCPSTGGVEGDRERAFDDLCRINYLARSLRCGSSRPELLLRHTGHMRVGIVRPTIRDSSTLASTYLPLPVVKSLQQPVVSFSPDQRARIYGFMSSFFTKGVFSASVDKVRSSGRKYFTDYRFITVGYMRYELTSNVRRRLLVQLHIDLYPLLDSKAPRDYFPHWAKVFQWLSCTCVPREHERLLRTETGSKRCRHTAQLACWFLQDVSGDYAHTQVSHGSRDRNEGNSKCLDHRVQRPLRTSPSKSSRECTQGPQPPVNSKRARSEEGPRLSITSIAALAEEVDECSDTACIDRFLSEESSKFFLDYAPEWRM